MADAMKITDTELENLTQKTGDDPAYAKQMLEKADQGLSTDDSVNRNQGQLLAGKYKTPEELEKGVLELLKKQNDGDLEGYYKTLESGMGKPATDETPGETEEKSTSQEGSSAEGDALSQAAGGGSDEGESSQGDSLTIDAKAPDPKEAVDFEKYTKEIIEKGQLTDDSYQELEEAGFPKTMVDDYIEGQKAREQMFRGSLFDMAGGKDSYDAMVKWAAGNLNDAEKSAFNDVVQSRDLAKLPLMVDALKARYTRANGQAPKTKIEPGSAQNGESDVYKSIRELSMDQRDPRYKTDPAFRANVMKKAQRSKI